MKPAEVFSSIAVDDLGSDLPRLLIMIMGLGLQHTS